MAAGRQRRVLLLQVRDDEAALEQERFCFLESAGLEPQEMESVNLVEEPEVDWRRLRASDAVFIGGAGAHTVTETYPFTAPLAEAVGRAVEEGHPLFGSCWGHHLLVRVLGGEVVTDHASGEVGTFDVELTPEGRADPLFAGFPGRFAAQLGHHDRVGEPPDGLEELAVSERCRYQAVRLPGKPIYGTQFHSEMNHEHMQTRLMMYRDSYLSERTTAEEVSRSLRPSPEAERLLSRFLELYA